MKALISLCSLISALVFAHDSLASPQKIRVSVTEFTQEAPHIYEHCRGWDFSEQGQLRTVLESELTGKGLQILDRKNIRGVYRNEFEMANLNESTVQKRKQFIAAKYTITGGITELGICESSNGQGLNLGGVVSLLGGPSTDLDLSRKKVTSTVKVTAKIISTETGEILRTFTTQGEIEDASYGVSGGVAGVGGSHHQKKKPPIERASNEAIAALAKEISEYLKKNET